MEQVMVTITTVKRKSGWQARIKYDGIGIIGTNFTGYETKDAALSDARKNIQTKADCSQGGSEWQIKEIAGK